MFEFQIRSMRQTINKLLKQRRPPAEVGIMLEHANYLECKFHAAPSIRPAGYSGCGIPGKPVGSMVMVRLSDLYNALKKAKGIDEQQ